MADPKYANLPGIARDQPDVYETTDLPEVDQSQASSEEAPSENVEQIQINANDSFEKFKGKSLDASKTDFSDKVGPRRKTGYDIPRTEYEMLGDGSGVKETPQQKYQRLQHEIRELADEVNQVKENVKVETAGDALSPVAQAKQVEYLQHQLTDLHLDKLLGTPGAINLSDPQGALQKRLLTEIDGFNKGSPSTDPKSPQATAKGDVNQVTYQLYYRPEQAKFSNNARLADIEQRMERIEALLGSNPEKLSALTADTTNKSLVGAVATLTAKTKLLDPSQLDHLEGRLHAVSLKLSQLGENKETAEENNKLDKVTELYDLVKKWDSMSNTLPHLADRLTALKELHEQALQFSQALASLDTAQQQIAQHLQSHGDMLKEVQSALTENVSSIKANCDSLDGRVKALSK